MRLAVRQGLRRLVRGVAQPPETALRRLAATRPLDDPVALRLEWVAGKLRRTIRRVDRHLKPERREAPRWTGAGHGVEPLELETPLVLIGQAGRSGGTLLLRLFDEHHQCLVVPHELGRLLPTHPLVGSPEELFDLLTPKTLVDWHARGIRIGKRKLGGARANDRAFTLDPDVLRATFVRAVAGRSGGRAVLDAYFSSYFAAWGDAPSVEPGQQPAWTVGFEPSALAKPARMAQFDAHYPDGKVLAAIRDPWSWLVSARRWSPRFADPRVALRYWLRSTDAALARRDEDPARTLLFTFDALLLDPVGTMRAVAAFLDIDYVDTLVRPTLLGGPAGANSSFPIGGDALAVDPVRGRREHLKTREERLVTRTAGSTWDRVLKAATG